MAFVHADRVEETTTTTGFTDFVLSGASTSGAGFQTFLSKIGNGNTCYYLVIDTPNKQWETGIATIATAGPTLQRTTVHDGSSGAATKVNFSAGPKRILCSINADLATVFKVHIDDATLHFTEGSIDHVSIQNVGSNSHADIDTHITAADAHIADGTVHFTEGSIDHVSIQNIGANSHADIDTHIADDTKHRLIDDSGTSATVLWSADKIAAELAVAGVRKPAVIDLVTNTSVPPTEVLGDRYILDDTGVSHGNWDGADAWDIVEFNGVTWDAEAPEEGWKAYVDVPNADYVYKDDPSVGWVTAGTGGTITTSSEPTNVSVSGLGSIAGGYADASGGIYAKGIGAVALGHSARGAANGIYAQGVGSFAQGYVPSGLYMNATGIGSHVSGHGGVKASGTGSFAHGYSDNARGVYALANGSVAMGFSSGGAVKSIYASSIGAFAQGYVDGAGERIQAQGIGSFAQGRASGGNIEATYSGAFAQGVGDITASGRGSFARASTLATGAANVTGAASFLGAAYVSDTFAVTVSGNYSAIVVAKSTAVDANITGDVGFIGVCDGSDISGDYGVIVGGKNNYVPNDYSCIVGGVGNNTGSGYASIIGGGKSNTITYGVNIDYNCILGGLGNTLTGPKYSAIVGGQTNDISATPTHAFIGGGQLNEIKTAGTHGFIGGGYGNDVTASYAAVLCGSRAVADKWGQHATASGRFTSDGDAQSSNLVARLAVTHSDATWHELHTDGSSTQLTLAADTAWTFTAHVVGATAGMAKSFGFKIEGMIENDGGTTTIKGSSVTTVDDADDTSYDARVTADDTNDALMVEVSDSDGTGDAVRWVCHLQTVELTFA